MKRPIHVAMVCLVMASAAMAQSTKTVYRVSVAERADGKGYVVRLHTRGNVDANDLIVRQDALDSAEIILEGATASARLERGDPDGPIRGYELDNLGDGSIRTTLSLDPQRPVRILAYPDRNSHDALIALSYAQVAPRVAKVTANESELDVASEAETRTATQTAIETDVKPEPIQGAEIVLTSLPSPKPPAPENPISRSEVAGAEWKLDCVVIDAGHGGKDPGAVANGVREKDVNLAVAKKLGFYLEDRLGLRVVYTRSDDRFIPLKERGRIANEQCGKLFISLHVNSARRRSAEGTEIYFLGLHKTSAARDVMERENSVIQLEANPEQYVDLGSEQAIMETLAQSVHLRESELLAALVHDQFKDRAMRPTRGVKQAGFLVLWKASMPAILVELGFVTNRSEARYLKSSRGHDLLASAIFRAVRAYRDIYEQGLEWSPTPSIASE